MFSFAFSVSTTSIYGIITIATGVLIMHLTTAHPGSQACAASVQLELRMQFCTIFLVSRLLVWHHTCWLYIKENIYNYIEQIYPRTVVIIICMQPGGRVYTTSPTDSHDCLQSIHSSTRPQQLLWALGSQSASIVVTAPMHISMKQMRADKQTVAVHSWAWILSNKTYQSNTQYVSPHQQFLSSYTVCSCTTFLEQKNLICFNNLSRVKW